MSLSAHMDIIVCIYVQLLVSCCLEKNSPQTESKLMKLFQTEEEDITGYRFIFLVHLV